MIHLYDVLIAFWEDFMRWWRKEELSDRNQLLKKRFRKEIDSCGAFQSGEPGDGDCETDGHYLCAGCLHMSHEAAVRRGLVSCENCKNNGEHY